VDFILQIAVSVRLPRGCFVLFSRCPTLLHHLIAPSPPPHRIPSPFVGCSRPPPSSLQSLFRHLLCECVVCRESIIAFSYNVQMIALVSQLGVNPADLYHSNRQTSVPRKGSSPQSFGSSGLDLADRRLRPPSSRSLHFVQSVPHPSPSPHLAIAASSPHTVACCCRPPPSSRALWPSPFPHNLHFLSPRGCLVQHVGDLRPISLFQTYG
jgi:hypothetical protein